MKLYDRVIQTVSIEQQSHIMEICDDDFLLHGDIDDRIMNERYQFNYDLMPSPSSVKSENLLFDNDVFSDDSPLPLLSPPEELFDDSCMPINPDDFFNDMYKSDVEIKSESSSSRTTRDTPSPSISSGSSDLSEFRIEMPVTNSIDTPPISPESIQCHPQPIVNQNINIIHGTLIPITTSILTQTSDTFSNLKRVKIQPKPIADETNVVKSGNAKTIVLSSNDYKAFVQRQKSEPDVKPVIIKTTTPVKSINTKTSSQIRAQLQQLPPPQVKTLTKQSLSILNPLVKQEINDKMLKKQQRMIKNRESACLSRKKKKDYVTSLEAQISNLSKENQKLKTENNFLKNRLTQLDSVVCKCRNLSAVKTVFGSANKKNAVFMLALMVMVTVNFGPFGKLLSPHTSTLDTVTSNDQTFQNHHTRSLLWVDDNLASNTTYMFNDSSIATDSGTKSSTLYPTCPISVNQSESIRLASELRRWIGDFPEYQNKSKALSNDNFNLNSISDYFLPEDAIKSLLKEMKNVKNYLKKKSRRRNNERNDNNGSSLKKGVEPFKGKIQVYNSEYKNGKYAELFEEIGRQDDTFYVVSFTGDHLLLPALAHNKTLRPKMSLMLPAVNLNGTISTDHVTLMQIDCEVLNTSLIRIKESLIPIHLRTKTESTGNVSCSHVGHNTTDLPDLKLNSEEFKDNSRSAERARSLLFPHKPYFRYNSSNEVTESEKK